MAQNYGTILGVDPVVQASAAAQQRLQAERDKQQALFQNMLQNLTPAQRQGAITGQAFGQLLGAIGEKQDIGVLKKYSGGDTQAQIDSSPEVTAAKQNLAFARDVQGIQADPASSDWATQVAAKAKALGREDVALQYLAEAAARRKAEAKLEADAQEKQIDNLRSAVNGLGNGGRASWLLNNPDEAKLLYGLDDKGYTAMAKDAAAERDTIIAKNAGELRKLYEGVKVDTTDADTNQVLGQFDSMGLTEDTFKTGYFGTNIGADVKGADARLGFASRVAQAAKAEQALASKSGQSRTIAEIADDIIAGAKSGGILTPNEPFKAADFNQYLNTRRSQYSGAPASPVTTAPQPAGAQAQAAPSVKLDFDFTQPTK